MLVAVFVNFLTTLSINSYPSSGLITIFNTSTPVGISPWFLGDKVKHTEYCTSAHSCNCLFHASLPCWAVNNKMAGSLAWSRPPVIFVMNKFTCHLFFSPTGWMFSASSIPQRKNNYDRSIAFLPESKSLRIFHWVDWLCVEIHVWHRVRKSFPAHWGSSCTGRYLGARPLFAEAFLSPNRGFFQGTQLSLSNFIFSIPSVSFTEQSSKVHLGIPRAYFSSCWVALLKLAAEETSHKEVTHACMF